MSNMPFRVAQMNVSGFIHYLAESGAQIGVPSNTYEVVRYRSYPDGATKMMTSIVYRKENGQITWTGASFKHYQRFLDNLPMQPRVVSVEIPKDRKAKEPKGEVKRAALLERDGSDCWFCGKPLGEDITIEHLVPRSKGGVNHLDNYVLAHQSCNLEAANKPLVDKIALRNRMMEKAK